MLISIRICNETNQQKHLTLKTSVATFPVLGQFYFAEMIMCMDVSCVYIGLCWSGLTMGYILVVLALSPAKAVSSVTEETNAGVAVPATKVTSVC